MSKIKILVAPGDRAGSGKYRCVDPHVNLQKNHQDDFFVDINYEIDFSDINYLKQYDVVFFHRMVQNKFKDSVKIITNLKKMGLKVIVDTDDYWFLDSSHGLYAASMRDKIPQTIMDSIRLADLVTVPTKFLAKEVKTLNKNVVVLPNGLDPNEPQFQPNPTESELIRFGWLGGSSHVKDLELLRDLSNMQNKITKPTQFVICGFDTRGVVQRINPETKQLEQRQMAPQETTWFLYELFLTDNYKNLEKDEDYLRFLVKFTEDINYDDKLKPYRRIWTKPINKYAYGYNEFDVALAPLNDSIFNMYKSQLKVIEAGFHKKAIIAQNYGPYTIDLINAFNKGGGLNENGNALLVDTNKNHKNWFKYVKYLAENPNMIKQLGEKLYETVKDEYNLNNISKLRAEAYKNLKNM